MRERKMPSRNKRSRPARPLLALVLFATAITLAPNAGAQGKINSGALGPSGGSVGGGASGASNRGGAAGVSNPSPGASSSTLGGTTQNNGPRSTETARPGYLGGRTTEEPVTPPSPAPTQPPGTTTTLLQNVTQFGKCPTVGASSAQARMSGNNLGRIDAVAQYLTQQPAAQRSSTVRYLLADMQEELEKPHPDLTLAATYLGIASGQPITPALVSEVSASLCSPVSPGTADAIAPTAEAQRKRLLMGR
jgi:hypothetical protein